MANVVTQIEMMKFSGMDSVAFPFGTIVTPAAKDWAKDHKINIVIGQCDDKPKNQENQEQTFEINLDKSELLKKTTAAMIQNIGADAGSFNEDKLAEAIIICLERMGCKVEK